MEKLTFFALSAPEKLDRIAAYLSERLTRELNRHRYGYVCIAMEAMEQLLLACHCQSINLLGVVRKTVDDELQVNIWEPRHMEQIVPALLVNLQQSDSSSGSPAEQTEVCFRELLGRAAYGHINNAIKPVLMHLDSHGLWEAGIVEVLSEAAVIEATGSVGPTVLEVFNTLLRQLRQSVDYQLTGYYDNAGKHKTTSSQEKMLQDAVIKTIGSFANTLPVYQRSEVMLFIMGKIPVPGIYPALGSPNAGFEGSRMIQVMLLKSLLQVSERYESSNLLSALPSSFLEPLLSFTLMEDPEIRLLVLSILTSLIDRHHNAKKLLPLSGTFDVSELDLKEDRCSRQDNLFMRKSSDGLGSTRLNKSITVLSGDSLAELRTEEHAGSLSSSVSWGRAESDGKSDAVKQQKKNLSSSSPDETSEDDFQPLSGAKLRSSFNYRPSSSSSVSSVKALMKPSDRREVPELDDNMMETQRDRWRTFRERKNKSAVLHLRLKKAKPTPSEPIVLSSEEEEEVQQYSDKARQTQSSSRVEERGNSEKLQVSKLLDPPQPSFLQLEFCSLHVGLMEVGANGPMMITENGIILPVKGTEDSEVTVVASQLRGYGVWNGGVAQGGTLLADWEGPAPSLLFLWVSEAQANLLQRELWSAAANAPSCTFVLLVLKEQLQDLKEALFASILDMEEYKQGRSSSCFSSPIDWTDGLLLIHSCPPPVDQHLLRLLGHSSKTSPPSRTRSTSARLLQLPTRLIQYPLVPCKGRITVTEEDLACLEPGEFLNDVIIDFYLKFLLLEGVGGTVAQRSHVFSTFFYKQLSRRRAAGEDDAPSVPDRHTRHQRVKTWTRHVDIFTKDFLFVPVNQEAHWFLVVVCFPGLEEVRIDEFQTQAAGGSGKPVGNLNLRLRAPQPPESTQLGCGRSTVTKRPCLLVMDSLKLSYHENVCRLIRDYLQVEWEVRRKTPRLFTHNSMRSCNCRVPQQDNSSDCGLYLLQYVESFLQNPVVHFDLPVRLESWFPRQQVRQKREDIRRLIMRLQQSQTDDIKPVTSPS
uniref:EFR3 homolog Ba n=2 Tax=Nothobranchius korthausae TaxID=1143690 RepID=A0A1A8GPM4_9TELE